MLKKLAFFTSARSDFGPLIPLISRASQVTETHLLVGGAHYSASRGNTANEVLNETQNLPVRLVPLEFLLEGETPSAQAKSVAMGQASLAQWLSAEHYDAMVIIGDRWELFTASIPALLFGIPIAHISGGEITQGAIDDIVRHAHSKLAHLHFAAADTFAENLSRMGEEDWRITVCGECGLDSVHRREFATVTEIQERFSINLDRKSVLVTFHPSTMGTKLSPAEQVNGMLEALSRLPGLPVIITAPGIEKGSEEILAKLEAFCANRPGARFIASFGRRNYLAVLKEALAVVGNSSSGIVEAASFGVPAVNIGDRQLNRPSANSVLHTGYQADEIEAALRLVTSCTFQHSAQRCRNPYDPYCDGRSCERILYALLAALERHSRTDLLTKKFVPEVHPAQWNSLLEGFR